MKTMIKAEHVSIGYKIGDFKDIGLKEWTMRHLKGNFHVENFMAVNDVSFELKEGDMLGIIGANGAGKSTLLKAVIGVMEPRGGKIERNGNVSALLELASGFDGDLTVRENAYLRGAMLSYTKEFMDKTYEQILDFSELRDFAERPFKQLSTGMQSRLAFSIASLVQPEILILDEVLSVGDGAFQEKSAAKMRDIIANGAATIMVSHSLVQIRELCNKVLWLDKGREIAFGDDVQGICDKYEDFLVGELAVEEVGKSLERTQDEQVDSEVVPRLETEARHWEESHNGTKKATITDVSILNQSGRICSNLCTGKPYSVRIGYAVHEVMDRPYCGVAFYRKDGLLCYGTNMDLEDIRWEPQETGVVHFNFDACPLLPGQYTLDVAISEYSEGDCDYFHSALTFEVVSSQRSVGVVSFPHHWKLTE